MQGVRCKMSFIINNNVFWTETRHRMAREEQLQLQSRARVQDRSANLQRSSSNRDPRQPENPEARRPKTRSSRPEVGLGLAPMPVPVFARSAGRIPVALLSLINSPKYSIQGRGDGFRVEGALVGAVQTNVLIQSWRRRRHCKQTAKSKMATI